MSDTCRSPDPLEADAPHGQRWTRIAIGLVAVTIAYNVIEGALCVWEGDRADSVALFGFGLDSGIECAAASLTLWRLSLSARGASRARIESGERIVRRFVGGTFLALALYVAARSGLALWSHAAPRESRLGIAVAIASLIVMPALAVAKLRAARELKSSALRAEAKETLVCTYLSFVLLVGLCLDAWLGWWWVDSLAALAMVPWLVKEGREGIRGEECCDED